MNYIDYVSLNPFQRFLRKIVGFFINLPRNIGNLFKGIGRGIVSFFKWIINGFKNYGNRFSKGDSYTKLSYIIMGTGNIGRGQILKGLLFFACEVAYFVYMASFGIKYLSDFTTLGTQETYKYVPDGGWKEVTVQGDNSMFILLFSVLSIMLTVAFFALYIANTKSAYNVQVLAENGRKIETSKEMIHNLLDKNFHVTLLTIPTLMVCAFTILPLIFMILIAFTNYNIDHQPPGKLFTWVGLDNFSSVFFGNGKKSRTFFSLLQWTIVWAIFATFVNYILGMVLALLINKKGIKLKAFWRTLFVITIAVPNFVTLMLMSQILSEQGAFNVLLQDLHITDHNINFIGDPGGFIPKVTVIIVNCWIGIPYTMLITSGILMNIPEELYESAKIDGAGPVRTFVSITLPYMLFVTTPYLITQFVGNINNFNVIFLLTGGGPSSQDYYNGAGKTDLLVTWLYKLTVNTSDFDLAATIGILVFIICAFLSLITFNSTKSAKNEEEFS